MEDNHRKLVDKSINFRGTIIENITALEIAVDMFLSAYFSKDELLQTELLNVIFRTNRITFESKRQVFDYILKTHFPEVIKDHPKLMKDLISIIEKRNILAHYILSKDLYSINNPYELTYLKYKNDIEPITFKAKEIILLNSKILRCAYIILKLTEPLFSTPPSSVDPVHHIAPS